MEPVTLSYRSKVSGNSYPAHEYTNHGWGGEKRGFKDLPHDEYPYVTEYISTSYDEAKSKGMFTLNMSVEAEEFSRKLHRILQTK